MKKTTIQTITIIIAALLFCLADNVMAQNVTKDAQGNYHRIDKQAQDSAKATPTGAYYVDDKQGVKIPVYLSVKGKEFILRTSKKTGKSYKFYIKL